MPAMLHSGPLMLLVLALIPQTLQAQNQKERTEEEIHAEESRKIFEAVHCGESNPEAVRRFEGCWKVGAVAGAPTTKNLSLGMRMSVKRAQLMINSFGASQAADSDNPGYCVVEGQATVAPYRDAEFCCKDSTDSSCKCMHGQSYEYTYVYIMLDLPREQAESIAAGYFSFVEEKISKPEYVKAVADFAEKGGKYIRTLINMGPTHVWWDSDAEEDFWALPASCDRWEEVEKKLKDSSVQKSPEVWVP